jgi:hypothetical protein
MTPVLLRLFRQSVLYFGSKLDGENEPSVELNDDLAGAVVIDLLELANVACK